MIGQPESSNWITVAADIDDVPQPGELGKLRTERRCLFAYRDAAEQWIIEQAAEGYAPAEGSTGIASCATLAYTGPTDAPGNCWSVTVEKITGRVVREPKS